LAKVKLRCEDMAMEHEHLVRLAGPWRRRGLRGPDARFQHFAFGSALALVRDFQQAEDVVQGGLRGGVVGAAGHCRSGGISGLAAGIVRHQALRMLRRRQLRTYPSLRRKSYRATNRRPTTV